MFAGRVQAPLHPDQRQRALEQLGREAAEVPERFAGCRQFRAFVDPVEPDRFLLYEEWDDVKSFERYKGSEYFADAGSVLMPALSGAPDSAYYTAELVRPWATARACG